MSVIKTDMAEKIGRLVRYYEDVLKYIPGARADALKAGALAALEVLKEEIDNRLDDPRGKVKSWQQVSMGRLGGYSRVGTRKMPVENRYGKQYGYTSTEVTYYLEHGHAIPSPSGRNKRYEPRLDENKGIWGENGRFIVPGRMFYSYARMEAKETALKAMEDVLEELSEEYADKISELIDLYE